MRAILWILAIALAGGAAIFLAWRLLPVELREGAAPPAVEARADSPQVAPANIRTPAESAGAGGPQPERDPSANAEAQAPDTSAPEPAADGLEEGGLAQAGRPLLDFSSKYAERTRSERRLAAAELERTTRLAREELTPAELADLQARLANQVPQLEPTPRVAALLAQLDELEWLRQRLALPAVENP